MYLFLSSNFYSVLWKPFSTKHTQTWGVVTFKEIYIYIPVLDLPYFSKILPLLDIIIPQVSFGQSDCIICGQYDVILPVLDKKYDSDALFGLKCKQIT